MMYKELLRSIAGIGLFPVISLVLFVTVFSVAVIRALCMDRAGVEHLAGLPFDDGHVTPHRTQEGSR